METPQRPNDYEGGSEASVETPVPSRPDPIVERVERARTAHLAQAADLLSEPPAVDEVQVAGEPLPPRTATSFFGMPAVKAELLETSTVISKISSSSLGQLAQTMAILNAREGLSDTDQAFLAEEAGRAMTGASVRVIVPAVSFPPAKAEEFRGALLTQVEASSALSSARFQVVAAEKQFHQQKAYLASRPAPPPPSPEAPEPQSEEPYIMDFNVLMPDLRKGVQAAIERYEERARYLIKIVGGG